MIKQESKCDACGRRLKNCKWVYFPGCMRTAGFEHSGVGSHNTPAAKDVTYERYSGLRICLDCLEDLGFVKVDDKSDSIESTNEPLEPTSQWNILVKLYDKEAAMIRTLEVVNCDGFYTNDDIDHLIPFIKDQYVTAHTNVNAKYVFIITVPREDTK